MTTQASKNTFLKLIDALNAADQYGRRHDYAFRHSQGRTESTKELTETEAWAVMQELKQRFGIDLSDKMDRMRKKIISYAHQMGWQRGVKADMARINKWCVEMGPFKKPLNDHKEQKELATLVSVFEKIYKQYLNKL